MGETNGRASSDRPGINGSRGNALPSLPGKRAFLEFQIPNSNSPDDGSPTQGFQLRGRSGLGTQASSFTSHQGGQSTMKTCPSQQLSRRSKLVVPFLRSQKQILNPAEWSVNGAWCGPLAKCCAKRLQRRYAARTSGRLWLAHFAPALAVDLHCLSPSASIHQSLTKVTIFPPPPRSPPPTLLYIAGRTRAHDSFSSSFIFFPLPCTFTPL